jgi:tRNA-dihydrouridine synthase B
MRDMELASKIIKSVIKATPLKVSVKFRKGWDHSHVNAVDFARMCEDSGASYITIHGRTRNEFYSGSADWDIIAEVKSLLKIPVVGNGDVADVFSAKKMLDYTKADAVMIGRAALCAPWLIAEIDNYLKTGALPERKTPVEIKEIMLKHIGSLRVYYGYKTVLPLSRKYVCWYSKGLYDAKRFREKYVGITGFDNAYAVIEDYFNSNPVFEDELK